VVLDKSHCIISIGGLIVKSKAISEEVQEDSVMLPSVLSHLKDLALHVSNASPVCLIGPIGSGKSSLVRHIASIFGRKEYPDFISVQMSDQVDSRLLLGSYHSTDLPGQFVWKPGCLTRAVLNGHWVLFEDLDSAPMDVITLLDGFIDNKFLSVPGYGEINHIHPDFRIFATCRAFSDTVVGRASEKIGKSWMKLQIRPFSAQEIKTIVASKYPYLRSIVDRLVETYDAIKALSKSRKGDFGSSRPVSIRFETNFEASSLHKPD
jgi:midasin